MCHTLKNAAQLVRRSNLGKMRHSRTLCHSWKNAPHFENYARLRKKWHIWKNGQHLEKCATLEKMRPSVKIVPNLEK